MQDEKNKKVESDLQHNRKTTAMDLMNMPRHMRRMYGKIYGLKIVGIKPVAKSILPVAKELQHVSDVVATGE